MNFPLTLFAYIGRQLLIWFVASFALILGVVFLGDLVELMRRAAGLQGVRIGTLAQMALLKMPFNAQEVTPFAVLIGSILALRQLTRSQELVIARAAGVSVWQFLAPAIASAFLIGVIGVTVFNPVAARSQRDYTQFDNRVLRKGGDSPLLTTKGLWLRQRDDNGIEAIIHGERQAGAGMLLDQATFLFFDDHEQVIRRIDAQQARLDDNRWLVSGAWDWHPGDHASRFVGQIEVPSALTTQKIEQSFASPETISFWALPGFIDLLEKSGFSAQRHRLYFDSLLARPFLLCSMVLIAAIFSLRIQRRGGTTTMLVGGVASGFILYFLSDVAFALGSSATIPVVLAAWTPAGVSTLLGATILLHLEDG
jgi:lipopolysaccharide export system permease protein